MQNKTLLRVKIALWKQGMTQARMARATGLRAERISRILHGHLRPRARDRRLIAGFLGICQARLFGARKGQAAHVAAPKGGRGK
jgi:transcriptional regulator with XRE-family HTH domain